MTVISKWVFLSPFPKKVIYLQVIAMFALLQVVIYWSFVIKARWKGKKNMTRNDKRLTIIILILLAVFFHKLGSKHPTDCLQTLPEITIQLIQNKTLLNILQNVECAGIYQYNMKITLSPHYLEWFCEVIAM
jgi:hypothetical protein